MCRILELVPPMDAPPVVWSDRVSQEKVQYRNRVHEVKRNLRVFGPGLVSYLIACRYWPYHSNAGYRGSSTLAD